VRVSSRQRSWWRKCGEAKVSVDRTRGLFDAAVASSAAIEASGM
jgi:hypothetical protein